MSILANYIMRQIMGGGGQGDDALAKENRNAYRKQLEKAHEAGDTARLDAIIPEAMKAGIDVGPYRVKPPAEAQIQNEFNQMLLQSLGLSAPPQPSPFESTEVAYDIPENAKQRPTQRPTTAAMQQLEKLFTPEFAARVVAKQAGGITVDEHALTDRDWFNDYARLPDSMDASSKKEMLAAKYGYIPMQASQLKDLSIEERKSVTEGAIAKFMADPEVDAAFRRSFPDADDKTKMGIVLHRLATQEGMPIPDRYQPFLDRFLSLRDDIIAMEGAETASEAYYKAIGQEQAAAQTFGGQLGRKEVEARLMREINKPRLPSETVTKLGGTGASIDLSKRAVADIMSFVRDEQGNIDIDRLPVGPIGEAYRKRMDKYGIKADAARIRLRTTAIKLLKTMYAVQGKQLSDKEIELTMNEYVSMSDAPLQFITKFSEFQRNIINDAENTLEAYKAAGYDTKGLEPMIGALDQVPILEDQLKGGEGGTTTRATPPAEQTGISANELKALKAHPNQILTNRKTGRSWRLDPQGNPIEVTK